MTIWVLKDGDDYLAGYRMRVPSGRVASFGDACDLHVLDFADEAEARDEAALIRRETGERWEPFALDFADATAEDLDEHFDDSHEGLMIHLGDD